MSWDIFVVNLPKGLKSLDDLPKDFAPDPAWRRSEIITKVSKLYPECDFADPSWGDLSLPGCLIEFNLGDEEKLGSFALHVRGDGRAPDVVAHILGELAMPAVDPGSPSGLFEQDARSLSESFARWRDYRDKACAAVRDDAS
jgi:hypothetical protein